MFPYLSLLLSCFNIILSSLLLYSPCHVPVRNIMWDSDVDFDLAAFHALVRALKRTLRQLVEGALAHVLLQARGDRLCGYSIIVFFSLIVITIIVIVICDYLCYFIIIADNKSYITIRPMRT